MYMCISLLICLMLIETVCIESTLFHMTQFYKNQAISTSYLNRKNDTQWALHFKTVCSARRNYCLKLEVVLKWKDIYIGNIVVSLMVLKWRELLNWGVLNCSDSCILKYIINTSCACLFHVDVHFCCCWCFLRSFTASTSQYREADKSTGSGLGGKQTGVLAKWNR